MVGPLVSVITPCYRQARFLPQAVDSVLAQTYRPVEMLVVNDGSDDDTDKVAGRYGDLIRYFLQNNSGQSAARNHGLRHAVGEYVLFLDADDQLHPEALAWLVEAAGHATSPLCIMGCRAFAEDVCKPLREWMPPAIPALLPWFVGRNCGPPHCFLAVTRMVRDVGCFAEELAGCEDWDLWLRLAEQGASLVAVPQVGAFYRRHPESFSSQPMRMLLDRVRVLLRLHHRYLAHPERFGEESARELLEAEYRVRRRCLAHGAEVKVVRALDKAIGELRRAGLSRGMSLPRRTLESLLGGILTDRMALAYLRLFAPQEFASYRADIT